MAKTPDRIPFWKERYLSLEHDIGVENILIGLALGIITTSMYWKHCKKCTGSHASWRYCPYYMGAHSCYVSDFYF